MPDRRYPRMARVNELIREVLAEELERLADPELGFLTVTAVDVSTDLRHANVYYSVLGPAEKHEQAAAALRANTPALKSAMARQVRLKYIPDLVFKVDSGVARGERIEEILRELRSREGDHE